MHPQRDRRDALHEPRSGLSREQGRPALPAHEAPVQLSGPCGGSIAMSAVNWRRVAELHALALDGPVAARKQFLDGACADDPPGVRARVEELLELPSAEEGPLFDGLKQLFARTAE